MKALIAAVALGTPFAATTDPISLLDQSDGVNSHRGTTVALYCHKDPCAGSAKLGITNLKFGSATFSIDPKTTGKVPIKISKRAFELLKVAPGRKMKVTLTVTLGSGQVLTHLIKLHA